MTGQDWAERQRVLAAAGLLVIGRAAQEKVQSLPDLAPLIEAAQSSNVVMLSERAIDEILTLVPTERTIEAPPAALRTAQATLADPESHSPIGRTLAPVVSTEPTPAPRRHGLSHYSLDDFPMEARDVDSEIEIHFDITGRSTTEGKMFDMKSFFSDRLRQIRQMMIVGRSLPCLLYTSPSPRDRG